MPRDGGNAQNGPIEGETAVHGASGDATIEHTKNNVAPMPEVEKGEALEGMNASGGGDAPKAGHTGQGSAATDSNKAAPVDQATK